MIGGIDFSSVVDAGFVLLVTAACLKSMSGNSSAGERVAERWRTELRELERALRDLIGEAATASTSFDRRLVQRKSEIESLLKRLDAARTSPKTEAAPAAARSTAARPTARKAAPSVEEELDELPNESWGAPSARRSDAERVYAEEEDLGGLEELISQTEDVFQLTESIPQSRAAAEKRAESTSERRAELLKSLLGPAPQTSLGSQIEVSKADSPEDQTFRRLSIMDPTAYKIARRLLAAGTEIHIVARKLDIPVSEVRLLDRLMRQEGSEAVEGGPNYKPIETVPANKIVRERKPGEKRPRTPAPQPEAKREAFEYVELDRGTSAVDNDETLELAIEREIALL